MCVCVFLFCDTADRKKRYMHTQRRNEIVMAILNNRLPKGMNEEETIYYKAMLHEFYKLTTNDHCDYSDGYYTVNRIEMERLKRLIGFYNYTSAIRNFVLVMSGSKYDGGAREIAKITAWKDQLYNMYMDAVLDKEYRKRFETCILPRMGEQQKRFQFVNREGKEEYVVKKEEFWLKGHPVRYMVHKTDGTRVHLSSLEIFFIRLYKLLFITSELIKLSHPIEYILSMVTQCIVVPFETRIFFDYDRLTQIETTNMISLIIDCCCSQ
jgi:hypothetical protein